MPRKLAAGNWKMNGSAATLAEIDALLANHPSPHVDLLICTPATLIDRAASRVVNLPLEIGAQNCHPAESGAHTGDVSAEMIAEAGGRAVIVGHSERRADHHETDAQVQSKARAAHRCGLKAIICVGETLAEREAGTALEIVARQLNGSLPSEATAENTIIAYEPVWAIGTGHVPTADQIADMHQMMRDRLGDIIDQPQAAEMTL
ncbi:MAG: triose-phosphate isomerase, partial [Pseudomonadota bacterium]